MTAASAVEHLSQPPAIHDDHGVYAPGKVAGSVRALDESHPGYREHIHRMLRNGTGGYSLRAHEYSMERFEIAWPTRREFDSRSLEGVVFNCQRCGEALYRSTNWWCFDCREIVGYLQSACGLSMIQIAHGGEYDPPWEVYAADIPGWLTDFVLDRRAGCSPKETKRQHAPSFWKGTDPGDWGRVIMEGKRAEVRRKRDGIVWMERVRREHRAIPRRESA